MDLSLDSMAILSNACSQLNQLRRDNLKPFLNDRLSALVCKQRKENDPTEELFPKINETARVAKQGVALVSFGGNRDGGR